ncbi:hypothetical protein RMR21_019070 [Agrobacterium sp. rho-8.1]|nr:hypothetical protein [Agrobacterium sp. rho-8.1]
MRHRAAGCSNFETGTGGDQRIIAAMGQVRILGRLPRIYTLTLESLALAFQ